MSDPWVIYDEMIEAIPDGVTVVADAVGLRWCRILSSEDSLGVAYTLTEQSRPALNGNSTLAGTSLREAAQLVKSWNFTEAGLGMAAINAWYSSPRRAEESHFSASSANNWGQVFHPYSEAVAGKVVSVIGHFPFAPKPLGSAAELRVLERSPRPGDFPDPACEYLLPDSDYVFISGSAFVNKTMPRLLELAADATTVVLGPSTPLTTKLFEHKVDVIAGFVSPTPKQLFSCLGGLSLTEMYRYGFRVEQSRDAVPTSTSPEGA